jgi:chromosome segregation ATPase
MAMAFSAARQEGILAQAAANLRRRDQSSLGLTFKTKHDARIVAADVDDDAARARSERSVSVASAGSEQQSWQEWVESFVDARLEAHGEHVGEQLGHFFGPQIAALKRELEILRREVAQVREQLDGERGLRDLRTEIAQARSEVPKLPSVVQRLEESQARLVGEIARTKESVKRMRIDQSLTDRRVAKLQETTAARAMAIEARVETTVSSFAMREIDPRAAAALRNFATATLESSQRDDKKLWIFDPRGPAAGAA